LNKIISVKRKKLNNEKGLTLIEVMVSVIIITIIIFAVGENIEFLTRTSRTMSDENEIILRINEAIHHLSYDVRHAQKPRNELNPVNVENNGRQLRLFRFTEGNKMVQIIYRLEISGGEQTGNLVRYWLESSNNSYPYQFGEIDENNSTVILSGVRRGELFKDITDPTSPEQNIRLIQVDFTVDISRGRSETTTMTLMTRSRGDR